MVGDSQRRQLLDQYQQPQGPDGGYMHCPAAPLPQPIDPVATADAELVMDFLIPDAARVYSVAEVARARLKQAAHTNATPSQSTGGLETQVVKED